MAGYMRKVTEEILHAFPDRVVNLHPALLPSFVGAHAIRDAFESGVKVTGVTVHFADEEFDTRSDHRAACGEHRRRRHTRNP